MTGPPLYLVSACGSAEEFVAAFRRYADRTGLFIPSASPLPAGRKGHLALTLKDGSIMIEGEAEILQSSAKPTVLHGRPGMTVKFVEPDEPSRIVISELEKARLAMKPPPLSVPPRMAEVPAEPRPVPPAPSGRIDAANALAECVVIGDPSTLAVTANAPRSAFGNNNFAVPTIPPVGAPRPASASSPPPMRPKTPTAPPAERTKTPTVPPDPAATAVPAPPPSALASKSGSTKLTSIGFPAMDKLPAKTESGKVVSNATTLGLPAFDRKPDKPALADKPTLADKPALAAKPTWAERLARADLLTTQPGVSAPPNPTPASIPVQTPPLATEPGTAASSAPDEPTAVGENAPLVDAIEIDDEATAFGAAPVKKLTDPMPAAVPPRAPAAPPPTPAPPVVANPRAESAKHKATSIGFPAMRTPFETQPIGVVPPPSSLGNASPHAPDPPTLPKSGRTQAPPAPRSKPPTTPPLTPRHPTPVAPVPIVRLPSKAAPVFAGDEETTDLSSQPAVAATPLQAAAPNDSGITQTTTAPTRSGGMRASEILAAIPAGDWTMSPDESVPHALPPEAKVGAALAPYEPTPAPAPPPVKGPPTGDWTMSLDPETGWSEPAKVEKPAPEQPSVGNPVHAVASEKPINVVQWDEKPTGIGESKIEIDATLMEPAKAVAIDDDEPARIISTKPTDTPPPLPVVPTVPARPPSGFGPAERPSYPVMAPTYRGSTTDMMGRAPAGGAKRTKMIALAVAAGLVAVGAIVMLVLTLGGKKTAAEKAQQATTTPPPTEPMVVVPATPDVPPAPPVGSGSQEAAAPEGSGSQQAAAAAGSATEVKPAPADAAEAPAPVAGGTCKVDIKSTPPGAEVYIEKQRLGLTPGTFDLPCGTESKVSLRKKSFPNTVRAFTPDAGKPNKLTVALARPTFSVKVTSTPAGATITAGGKTMGVTPTTIRLPGNTPTAITLSKPGYAADTSRVTPKQNNASHHVTLKKGKSR